VRRLRRRRFVAERNSTPHRSLLPAEAGKPVATIFVDASTLTFSTLALSPGPQRLTITNPSDDTYTLDAAFIAN
jgi:hypothetical protein